MIQQEVQKTTALSATQLVQGYAEKPMTLMPSGRFITDDRHRKVAEMFQPGSSPAEAEAIKMRIVGSFNALPDLVGVLLRADKEGALWQALYDEGITDAYDESLSEAVKALGREGIATVAHRYELDLGVILAKNEIQALNANAETPQQPLPERQLSSATLQWLVGQARELKELKMARHNYSPEVLKAWDEQLSEIETNGHAVQDLRLALSEAQQCLDGLGGDITRDTVMGDNIDYIARARYVVEVALGARVAFPEQTTVSK